MNIINAELNTENGLLNMIEMLRYLHTDIAQAERVLIATVYLDETESLGDATLTDVCSNVIIDEIIARLRTIPNEVIDKTHTVPESKLWWRGEIPSVKGKCMTVEEKIDYLNFFKFIEEKFGETYFTDPEHMYKVFQRGLPIELDEVCKEATQKYVRRSVLQNAKFESAESVLTTLCRNVLSGLVDDEQLWDKTVVWRDLESNPKT